VKITERSKRPSPPAPTLRDDAQRPLFEGAGYRSLYIGSRLLKSRIFLPDGIDINSVKQNS
jgi:hypothetical protein